MVAYYKVLLGAVALMLGVGVCRAAEAPLRIGVSDSDGPPLVVLSDTAERVLSGGLIRDLGEALAGELGTRAEYVVLSRNRIEPALEASRVDIVCNANPAWYGNAGRLGWTAELFPQIERLVSLRNRPDITELDQLRGRRVGTIRGYHYPALEKAWASGARRQDEARLDLLVKAVQKGLVDVAVYSELEFSAWARAYPFEARQFKLHPVMVSTMPTMCAVAPQSAYGVDRLNGAIGRLKDAGRLRTLVRSYQWHPI